MVNNSPPQKRRTTIRSQIGEVHGGGRVRNPDLRLTQALRMVNNPPLQKSRTTINSQIGGVHNCGRVRSHDLRLTQALRLRD
ncbi:hypothetical protein SLEP1_g21977 [Rubroshorea leprosula]|uniref:Uncharacterized protein n=1 Tax=Rubroshorea leprosula TaxID=152421 RepID=A0AAV5JGJ6_9ROSI|nr:hypothetical protein SLEP1_g21977 [Rubroshorea leprosula]